MSLPLTHEFLSLMLGVRRAGVTGALNQLDRKGVIRLSRGRIDCWSRGPDQLGQWRLWHSRSHGPARIDRSI